MPSHWPAVIMHPELVYFHDAKADFAASDLRTPLNIFFVDMWRPHQMVLNNTSFILDWCLHFVNSSDHVPLWRLADAKRAELLYWALGPVGVPMVSFSHPSDFCRCEKRCGLTHLTRKFGRRARTTCVKLGASSNRSVQPVVCDITFQAFGTALQWFKDAL